VALWPTNPETSVKRQKQLFQSLVQGSEIKRQLGKTPLKVNDMVESCEKAVICLF